MPIAVLDIDFEKVPQEIDGMERFTSALILLRLKGRPVGQALLPVIGGKVGGENLREALMCAADSGFWKQWVRDYLDVKEDGATNLVLPTATVVVCTHDRPEDLRRCLNGLMSLPDDGQELLVIDNWPLTDETFQIVGSYEHVRYIREDLPGKNIACNRALREAKHEVVVFIDDDATPDPNWLRALLRNFEDPLVLCVTGLVMPLELETEAQICFQRLHGLGRGFKRTVFDCLNYNPLEGWEAGVGANMALRRSAVQLIGFFDERLGPGMPTLSGCETHYYNRILAAGYRIVYDPEALNWHKHRSEWKALRRQIFSYGMGGFVVWTRSLMVEGELGALRQAWDWIWCEVGNLFAAILGRKGSLPLSIVLARLCGAFCGPWTLMQAHWRLRKLKRQ